MKRRSRPFLGRFRMAVFMARLGVVVDSGETKLAVFLVFGLGLFDCR